MAITVHRLKVEGMDLGHAKVSIDDKSFPCRAVNVDMRVDQIHSATVELDCAPDIDIEAFITFGFTPDTVKQAVAVLRSELDKEKHLPKSETYEQLENLLEDFG